MFYYYLPFCAVLMPATTSKIASQALFQQTLPDVLRMLRGITTSADEEDTIHKVLEDTKSEISSSLVSVKVIGIQKVMYFTMLGHCPDFAFFPIVEVMADRSFANKRVAYMAATLCFSVEADVLPLTTGLLLRDLQSPNAHEQALALGLLSSVCTPDLARDVVSYVVDLLDTRYPAHIRKRAVVCLYKLFLEYPDALRPVYLKLKEKVDDSSPDKDVDSGVRGAVVCVLCELARRLPETYLGLAIPFYSLLSTIEGNWALIKVVKVFGYFVPHEPRLVKKLEAPLSKLIETTKATSVKYECYLTIMSTRLSTVSSLAELAVNGIKAFIEDTDQNLRFMGLEAASRLAATNPAALHPLRKVILQSLQDEDTTIRKKAAVILRDITTEKHLVSTVMQLMSQSVCVPADESWSNEVVRRIVELVRKDDYSCLTDFDWYVSVLLDLYRLPVEDFRHGDLIHQELVAILLRVSAVRAFAVGALSQLLLDEESPLPTPPRHHHHTRNSNSSVGEPTRWRVLVTATFACGEYATHLPVQTRMKLCAKLLSAPMREYPAVLQATCIWTVCKLVTSVRRLEAATNTSSSTPSGCWLGEVEELIALLAPFLCSPFPSVMETAMTLKNLLEHDASGECSAALFSGDLLPVAEGAQESCKAPDDVDLDALLCPREVLDLLPLSESEDEEEGDEEEGDDEGVHLAPTYFPGKKGKAKGEHKQVSAFYLDETEFEPVESNRQRQQAAAHADPARLTRQLMEQKKRHIPSLDSLAAGKGLMKPVVAGVPRRRTETDEAEEDDVTRRLRGVDVNKALTAADALPNTRLPYAALLDLQEGKRRKELEMQQQDLRVPPVVLYENAWVSVRLVLEKSVKGTPHKAKLCLRYRLEVEHLAGAAAASLTDVTVELCKEPKEGIDCTVWTAVELYAGGGDSQSGEEPTLVSDRIAGGSTASSSVTLVFSELPTSFSSSPICFVLSCVRLRKTTRIPMCVDIPFLHLVKLKSRSPPLSSSDFHSLLKTLPADRAAAEVMFAEVPCSRNDLLIAVPRLRTELGLHAVDVFSSAIALYADLVVPPPRGETQKGASRLFVFLREANEASLGETGGYAVTVSVRCPHLAVGEAAINAIVEILVRSS